MPSHGKVLEMTPSHSEDTEPSALKPSPRSDYDEWEIEERLRHLDRIHARTPLNGPLSPSHQIRIDPMHASVPRERLVTASPTQPRLSGLVRFGHAVLALGLAITVCGGSLAVWGYFAVRPDLLSLGIPIAVAGQILLLVGLVLQFDSHASTPRAANKTLRSRQQYKLGNANIRFDGAPDGTRQLNDLAARLEELSRKFEERDQG